MTNSSAKRIRLGELLIQQDLITSEQLQQALDAQKSSGKKIGACLVDLGYLEEDVLLRQLAKQLAIPFVDLKGFRFEQDLVRLLPEMTARRYKAMVLRKNADGVVLGMVDPDDIFGIDELTRLIKEPIKVAIISESELLDILDLAYSRSDEIATLAVKLDDELDDNSSVNLADIAVDVSDSEAPVVKLLQKIFEEAVLAKASDVHIEPDETVLRIRRRIDGVLIEQVMQERRIAAALVVRLKLMANLDISEKRLPQDGRFNLKVNGRSIDVRVSTMPVQFGESVVMRLLDHADGILALESIGMPKTMMTRFRKVINQTHGLILVTGPTGSGKTTTLYGALSELNKAENKILTVEDPVEYRLPRISQIQVHEKIGLNFTNVLRACLRQDPDILLVGEIRDSESAELALRAAMTGHLVLSTLHTNDAITSALRLIDLGMDGYMVAAALRAIVAQRLVRRICTNCIEEYEPSVNERSLLRLVSKHHDLSGVKFKRGSGCPHCFNSGYRGRVGVFEMLELNADMAAALRENSIQDFSQATHASPHFKPLSYSALQYAVAGITTLEEVMRVSAQITDEAIDEV